MYVYKHTHTHTQENKEMIEKTCWNCEKQFYCPKEHIVDGEECPVWEPDFYTKDEVVCESCMIQK